MSFKEETQTICKGATHLVFLKNLAQRKVAKVSEESENWSSVCSCMSSHITHFYNQKVCVQLHVGMMAVKSLTCYLRANLDMVALL